MYSSRHISTFDRYSAPGLIAAALAGLLTLVAIGQSDAPDFRTIGLGGQGARSGNIISWLDVSPDGSTIAVSHTQGFPLSLYPVDRTEGVVGIDLNNWYEGSRLQYSTTGRYVLMQQLFNLDRAPDKYHPIKYAVIEVATGSVVRSFVNIYAAALTPDESTVLTLDEAGVTFTDLATGKVEHTLRIDLAGSAIAVSRDGKRFALAHGATAAEMASLHTEGKDKDAAKTQVVAVYDMSTLQPIYSLNIRFKQVFRLEYSSDERDLLILAKSDSTSPGTPNPNHHYVEVADALFGEMRGISYPTSSFHEPDIRISPDGSLIALGSAGTTLQEVDIYDRGSGKMVDSFVVSHLPWERLGQHEMSLGAGRLSFDFLPDNKRMLLANGDRIIEWTYNR